MNHAKSLYGSLRIRVRENFNPYLAPFRLKQLKTDKFTIISNNCWGGHVYRYFGVPYTSPTIGLFFLADDYVRFCSNLNHYVNMPLTFIPMAKSRYASRTGGGGHCPIGVLDDLEVVFLHYKTEDEALEKWNRRKERIVWNNLYFKMSEMNYCTPEILKQFTSIPYNNKLVFTTRDYGLPCQIIFKEYENKKEIVNDTMNFRHYVNLTKWINGTLFHP